MARSDNYGTVRPDPRRRSFAQTPEALLRDRAVSDRAVRLWGLFDRIAAGREQAIGSRLRLAGVLGCSPSSLDRARRELEAAGWLGVERVDGEPSHYTVHDVPTYPQGVVMVGDTRMGVVTGEQTPSSPVTSPPSSLVTTEERVSTGEKRDTPPTPRAAGGVRCGQGHERPVRGCCARRDRERAASRDEDTARLAAGKWCGDCNHPDQRRAIDPETGALGGPCPRCHPGAARSTA